MQENTDIYESYVNHEMIAVELALYLSEINGLDLKTESEMSNFFKHAMCLSDNFIRLSYATSMKNIENGLNRIEEFLSQ